MDNLRLLGPMQFASLSEAPLTLLRILQQMVCVFWKRKRKFSTAAASSVYNLQDTLWVHFNLILTT